MLNLPFAYIALKLGSSPESVFVVAIIVAVACLFARLIMLQRMVGLSISDYLKKVFVNVIIVTVAAAAIPLTVSLFIESSLPGFLLLSTICVATTVLSELFIGCNQSERQLVYRQVRKFKNKFDK